MLAAQVYERLKQMAIYFPVAGQDAGSYLTINSNAGVQFMFIFFLSGLSQMLVSIPTHPVNLQSLVLGSTCRQQPCSFKRGEGASDTAVFRAACNMVVSSSVS